MHAQVAAAVVGTACEQPEQRQQRRAWRAGERALVARVGLEEQQQQRGRFALLGALRLTQEREQEGGALGAPYAQPHDAWKAEGEVGEARASAAADRAASRAAGDASKRRACPRRRGGGGGDRAERRAQLGDEIGEDQLLEQPQPVQRRRE